MSPQPRLLQGIYEFEGQGLDTPTPLDLMLAYTVPVAQEAQFVYFRGGNSSPELVCAVVMRDGEPMHYFPIAARASTHVELRVVEDLPARTEIEIHLAAPDGVNGHVVIDAGLVEI